MALSGVAKADGHASAPKVYGSLVFDVISPEDKDLYASVGAARVGVTGKTPTDAMTVIYDIELETRYRANNPASDQDIDVRTARFVIPGSWGAFVFGKTASGQWNDIYGGVDIFEENSGALFKQPTRASNVLAWKTPTVAGGLYGVVAALTLSEANEDDIDATAFRVVYKGENFKVAGGQVAFSDNTANDYARTAFDGSYKMGAFHLGATIEEVESHPADGDSTVTGLALSYSTGGTTFAVGHNNFDNDDDARDNNVTILNVSKALSDRVGAWFEHATYDLEGSDNTSIGLRVKF